MVGFDGRCLDIQVDPMGSDGMKSKIKKLDHTLARKNDSPTWCGVIVVVWCYCGGVVLLW